jgi:hypothetical protein
MSAFFTALWRGLYAVIVWFFGFVLNEENKALSLGRTMLVSWAWALIFVAIHAATHGGLATLLKPSPEFVILALVPLMIFSAYCFGDKPHVKDVLLALVSKLPSWGSQSTGLVRTAADYGQQAYGPTNVQVAVNQPLPDPRIPAPAVQQAVTNEARPDI